MLRLLKASLLAFWICSHEAFPVSTLLAIAVEGAALAAASKIHSVTAAEVGISVDLWRRSPVEMVVPVGGHLSVQKEAGLAPMKEDSIGEGRLGLVGDRSADRAGG